jgi:beta-1,4-mannosyltransferase
MLLAEAIEKLGHIVIPYQPKPKQIFSLIKFMLKNEKPDIFHLHWMHPFLIRKSYLKTIIVSILFIIEIIVLKFMRVKITWTVHNIISHEKIHPEIERKVRKILIGLFDHIIHLSRSSITIMNNLYMISKKTRDKLYVVPHGHYINYYKNTINQATARTILGINQYSIVLLCFGTIRPYKGIEILIGALNEIQDQNILLLIAGKPINTLIERRLCMYCKNNERIMLFLRFIPDNDVQIFMNAADIVILPYTDILNSGVAILSMSFGKTVIAPNIGSIPELIDKDGGILFNPKSMDDLVYAIKQAISLDFMIMGKYNFEKVSRLDWNSIARKTVDIYDRNYTKRPD